MQNSTQQAIEVIVQIPQNINYFKDMFIPFISVFMGALLGAYFSFMYNMKLYKMKSKFDLFDQAYHIANQVGENVFFLAIHVEDKVEFPKTKALFHETNKSFREFFSPKFTQNSIGVDLNILIRDLAEIDADIMFTAPKADFVKKCFDITHSIDILKNELNNRKSELFKNMK